MTQNPHKFSDAERAFHRGHSIEDSYRPDCRMCGGMATQTAPVTFMTTHDPMHDVEGLTGALYDGTFGPCRLCEFAAKVRADERKQAGRRVMSLPSGATLSVAAAVASGDVDAGVGW